MSPPEGGHRDSREKPDPGFPVLAEVWRVDGLHVADALLSGAPSGPPTTAALWQQAVAGHGAAAALPTPVPQFVAVWGVMAT